MSFGAPAAFLLLPLLIVIIALYLLKLRRSERVISSVFLWRKMVKDNEANAPWQRLRRNLLMVLQLFFLLTLILALARPYTFEEGVAGDAAIFIIDTSPSMAATDVTPNRLEVAKRQAHQWVDSYGNQARITIIAAGAKAQVMLAASRDRRQIHQAIEDIRLSIPGSDLGMALQLASAATARHPNSEIIVFSDGKGSIPENLTIKGNLRYIPIGTESANQAIDSLNLQTAPGRMSLTAFLQVTNYSDTPAKRRLVILVDGQSFNVFDVNLLPLEEQAILVEGLPPSTHLVSAQLLPDINTPDYLPVDDWAYAVHRETSPAKINLVSQGNLFLETALALLPGLELTRTDPEEVIALPNADLTIFDNFIPATENLPVGNLFFISPIQSTPFFTITGKLNHPLPQPADSIHPLLEHVSLEGVNILDAIRIPTPYWARPIILAQEEAEGSSADLPLLFVGEQDGRRIAVLTFDLHHSDLPLQVAFPILLSNLISWLAPLHSNEIPLSASPGEALPISTPSTVDAAQKGVVFVIKPDGSRVQLSVENGKTIFDDTNQLGFYQVSWGDSEEPDSSIFFAVNLFSPQESRIQPLDTLPLQVISTKSTTTENPSQLQREWWRYLALLALAILMIEWIIYHRQVLLMILKPGRPQPVAKDRQMQSQR